VGRNANLLLNVPPTREGLFHEADVRALAEFGVKREQTFAWDIAMRSSARVRQSKESVELEWRAPESIGMIVLREPIAHGQFVCRYRVEAFTAGEWHIVSRGTTIGHKKIDRFAPVSTNRVRVMIEDSNGPARLETPGLFGLR
jgi:alpha-L-fucosidase